MSGPLVTLDDYQALIEGLKSAPPAQQHAICRELCKIDVFFLVRYVCNRPDMHHPWVLARCQEVQAAPNGYLDLWGRGHYKSSVVTFGMTMQDILRDPETTVGIFSHTRPIAKAFLRQIKREMETNSWLKALFPEVLYENPHKEAPTWSEDSGIIVKRKSNPKESTVEAHGLVDGQPTSRHFRELVYDDVVTRESVTTPDMVRKVTEAWELSLNLGVENGIRRFVGTRYAFNDTYRVMMSRGIPARVYPATEDGTVHGKPVLLDQETLAEKRRDMGPYTFSCFPADAPILMADFREQPISAVRVGDMVVGYEFPARAKARIRPSRVLAVQKRTDELFEFTLASGRTVVCTADHKWYTGRRGRDVGGTDTHFAYSPIDVTTRPGRGGCTSHLVSLYDPREVHAPYDATAAAWLSGFYDGEGSTSANQIHFHQSSRYPAILERVRSSLAACGFRFTERRMERRESNWGPMCDFYLLGGRTQHMRFLNICDPAKSEAVVRSMFNRDARCFNGSKKNRDKVMGKRALGPHPVFNIETETGNYVAYGYATKNCQLLLDPRADETQGFKDEWLRFYGRVSGDRMIRAILVDGASAKKKESDYTAGVAVGLAEDQNIYVLEGRRDRLNLSQRWQMLSGMHRTWRPRKVGYEKYGKDSDIEHFNSEMERDEYRFGITALGGTMGKHDRIKRLIPYFEQGRIWLPTNCWQVDYEGKQYNWSEVFVEDEFKAFPVCVHEDILDALARIFDLWPMGLPFPRMQEQHGRSARAVTEYDEFNAYADA